MHQTKAVVPKHAHGANKISERIALKITMWVGTMICAGLFAVISIISLPAALATRDPVIIVQWTSGAFLQLVLLSILMIGGNLAAKAGDARVSAILAQLAVIAEKVGAPVLHEEE
jgi:hypothetical protein